ncbi:unnamed protein product, partial [Staurois parvus]
HGAPSNRGSWGPCVLAHTQSTPKKTYERNQGHLMGPPTDPGPSGSARMCPNGQSTPARDGLTTHGAPSNRGSWGPCVFAHTKMPMKGTRGISWGPLLTPGPLGLRV